MISDRSARLHHAHATAIAPALALLPSAMTSQAALAMLLAIGLQESRFEHRFQVVQGRPGIKGPARGWWQFERLGGVKGVIQHQASRFWMHSLCAERGIAFDSESLWIALEHDDVAAAAAARLLLFTDPWKLPTVGDEAGAWALYMRVWRPGRPHPDTWGGLYADACGAAVELMP